MLIAQCSANGVRFGLDMRVRRRQNRAMSQQVLSTLVRPLEGQEAWIISDGKAGHEAQCLGVAAALGVEPVIKRVNPEGVFKLASPWAPVARRDRFGSPNSEFAPPWPTLALATGRLTIPYIRALKRRAGLATFTVILLDPRTSASSCDLIWVPQHDRRRGPNVVTTLTSPHVYTPQRIAALRQSTPEFVAALPQPRIAVLIGGPNRDYTYDLSDIERLTAALHGLSTSGAGLMITPSRRTPDAMMFAIREATRDAHAFIWDGNGDNPYPAMLAHADAFVVTADSVNMTCEAAATGRPIHVFTPSGTSPKFDRFHDNLRRYGATRVLDPSVARVATWEYPPIDSAALIADEIRRRWTIRAEMLPGLVTDAQSRSVR